MAQEADESRSFIKVSDGDRVNFFLAPILSCHRINDMLPVSQSQWLNEGIDVIVMLHDSKPLGVELPVSVELTVTETVEQPKSATATNQLKEATLETGARVRVPPFIEIGQQVKINTDNGEYLGKA